MKKITITRLILILGFLTPSLHAMWPSKKLAQKTENVVIITHGFGGKKASWYQPGGDFYEAVKTEATKNDFDVVSFGWDQPSAGFFNSEQIKGALKLAQLIKSYKNSTANPNNKVVVIAHSYGGHVSAMASQFLNPHRTEPLFVLPDGTKNPLYLYLFKKNLKLWASILEKERELLGQASTASSEIKPTAAPTMAAFSKMFASFKEYFFPSAPLTDPTYFIDALYTLGTPHQPFDFAPDMQVINYLYNLNAPMENLKSDGDWVANLLAGSGELPDVIKKQPNTANLHVMIPDYKEKDGKLLLKNPIGSKYPTHSEMHHPIIGKWLGRWLDQTPMIENFSFNHDACIIFSEGDELPLYALIKPIFASALDAKNKTLSDHVLAPVKKACVIS